MLAVVSPVTLKMGAATSGAAAVVATFTFV